MGIFFDCLRRMVTVTVRSKVHRLGVQFVGSFGQDILETEEEVLPFLHDMSHVVVGTVSPVCDIDIAGFRKEGVTVYHGAEGAKFVLFMDRLEESIHIQMGIHIKQGVYMNTVKAFRRMASDTK